MSPTSYLAAPHRDIKSYHSYDLIIISHNIRIVNGFCKYFFVLTILLYSTPLSLTIILQKCR